MTQYIGVDLAWGEGSATKQAKETGLAEIDEHGQVIDAGWARGIDAVVEWIVRVTRPGAHREDLLDALLCAWTASIWHRHGEARTHAGARRG